MAINEAVNIDIDVNGTSTVKQAANAYEDLGDAVSKTQLEAEKLAQQFGINDKRTQEAIKVAGQYKQQMEELDFAIDAARGGTEQIFRAAQGVAAGFEVAAGATALFGSESEELEKILIKVQGAMVFSQGLRDLKEFAPAIFNAAEATRAWFTSLTLLQKSFVGLSIALIVDAIVEYRNSVSDAADETERLSEANRAYAERNEILIRSIQRETEEQVKRAILAGKTEDEILEIRKKGADDQLAYIQSLIDQEEKDKDSGLIKDQERFKLLARLEGEALREVDKLEVELFKLKEERRKKSTEINEENTQAIEKNNEEMQKLIDKQNELKGQTIETITETGEATMRTTEATLDFVEGTQKSALDRAKLFIGAYGQDIVNTFQETLSVVGALSNAFAGEDEARQKKAFEINKRLAIVQTTISTIEATVNAYKEAQKNPLNQATAGAYAVTQALLAAAFGLAQVQQIRSQSFTGGTNYSPQGNTGGNAPAANQYQASSIRFGEELLTSERRVFVLEGDITRTQNTVNRNRQISVVE